MISKANQRRLIKEAMKTIEDQTGPNCIKFVDNNKYRGYLHIVEDGGCWSYVGYHAQRQPLSLNRRGCMIEGTIIHELVHALGFVKSVDYHTYK